MLVRKKRLKPNQKEPFIGPFRLFLTDFFELSTCRVEGRAISYFDIVRYCEIKEYDFEEFFYIIRVLDNAYLKNFEKKKKAEDGRNNANKTNSNRR